VDWDFLVDHAKFGNDHDGNGGTPNLDFGVEGLGGNANGTADNEQGIDSLFFAPGITFASNHANHNHAGLGAFPATPDYGGTTFSLVDVFSVTARYSDADTDTAGNQSSRDSALDYDLLCLASDGTTAPGTLSAVFVPGWSVNSSADNYVARWRCATPATGVFILAHLGDGHDGTVHIDGVIVPEPTSLLWILGLLPICIRRRR
jgi:hypothetical protein